MKTFWDRIEIETSISLRLGHITAIKLFIQLNGQIGINLSIGMSKIIYLKVICDFE